MLISFARRLLIQSRVSRSIIRPGSSSRQSFNGFDIYRDIDYEAPFDQEEKSLILNQINGCGSASDLNNLGVAKTFASKLFALKEERGGEFEVVEQLLDIDGFNETRLEKLCKGILKRSRSDELTQNEKTSRREERRRRALLNCLEPKQLLSTENVDTVLGLKLSLESLSTALMCKEMLEELRIVSVPTYGHVSRTSLDPMRSVRAAKTLAESIPDADLYVIDFPNVMTAKNDKSVFLKAEQQMLTTALICELSKRVDDESFMDCSEEEDLELEHSLLPSQNCVLVKKQFLKQLFRLEVDNEWLSVADLARALVLVHDRPHIHQPLLDSHLPLDLKVPGLARQEKLVEFMMSQMQGTTRSEQIGSALMLAVGAKYLLDWTQKCTLNNDKDEE